MKVLNGIKKDPDNYLGCLNSHPFSRLVFTDVVSIIWKSVLRFAKCKLPMFFLKYEDVSRNYIYFLCMYLTCKTITRALTCKNKQTQKCKVKKLGV